MKYKAIFFDRDNTLIKGNPEKIKWRSETIKNWSGRDYNVDYDKMMELFDRAGYPKNGLKSVDEEIIFFKKYYEELLKEHGVSENLQERALILHNELWSNSSVLYDETIEVLEYFKSRGYKMGVISDTSPSLQMSLEKLGLGKYFDSYTCSDLVGVMKPEPLIYNTALKTLDVQANESIYVDDYDVESDGARDLGFLSFHIVRNGEKQCEWDITSLKEIINYIENNSMA